MAGTTIQAQS
jgi:hypothetical protein